MRIWLFTLGIATGLFVAGSALLAQPATPQLSLPQAISLTSVNAQGAALTQTIHRRSIIVQLVTDLSRVTPVDTRQPGCAGPGADADRYLAVLRYAHGARTTVAADKAGCERVVISGKGWPAGRAWNDPTLLRDFDGLFPPSWATGV